jgi:hypothetical protein
MLHQPTQPSQQQQVLLLKSYKGWLATVQAVLPAKQVAALPATAAAGASVVGCPIGLVVARPSCKLLHGSPLAVTAAAAAAPRCPILTLLLLLLLLQVCVDRQENAVAAAAVVRPQVLQLTGPQAAALGAAGSAT